MAGGPSLYPLTAALALSNLRIDLSDTNSSAYRWQDSDLNRAIDKALERYSRASPLFLATQSLVQQQCILYALPSGGYYTDSVEYPLGLWPKSFINFRDRKSPTILPPSFQGEGPQPPSGNPPTISLGAGSNLLNNDTYIYAVTYTCPGGGETTISPGFQVTPSDGSSHNATLTGLPIGPFGVTGRNIYRTPANTALAFCKFIGSIPDNVSGSFVDTVPEANLGAYPPASNSTQGIDIIELTLPPELWPADITRSLEITYASKHLLNGSGTTVPERHWNAFFLGSLAFAMWAYLPQVNDNFLYEDGHLRDRVDDTKSTLAWAAQCQLAMADFDKALEKIATEANAFLASQAHWGDKPWRWERL